MSKKQEEVFPVGSKVTMNKHHAEHYYYHWSHGLPDFWFVQDRPEEVKKNYSSSVWVRDPRSLDLHTSFDEAMKSMYVHASFLKAKQ